MDETVRRLCCRGVSDRFDLNKVLVGAYCGRKGEGRGLGIDRGRDARNRLSEDVVTGG